MSRVVTLSQLLALFPDNDLGEITALDGRDLIQTTFGYLTTTNPTANNDRVDSAGIGAFFDRGSRWLNYTSGQAFVCQNGTPTMALWTALAYDGELMAGRLGGYFPNPILAPSGVAQGPWGDSTHYPIFTVNLDGTLSSAGQLALPTIPVNSVSAGYGINLTGTSSDPIINLTSPISTSDVPSLDASKITTGTLGVGRIPSLPASQITSGVFANALIPVIFVQSVTAGSGLTGSGTALNPTLALTSPISTSDIPSLDASKITTGTLGAGRIPSLPASQITSGTFSTALIPGLPGSIITSGTIGAGFLPAGTASNTLLNPTGTTTNAYVSIFDVTNTNGLHGYWTIKNTGLSNIIQCQMYVEDFFGASGTGSSFNISASTSLTQNVYSPFNVVLGAVSPWKRLALQVKALNTGQFSTFNGYVSFVG